MEAALWRVSGFQSAEKACHRLPLVITAASKANRLYLCSFSIIRGHCCRWFEISVVEKSNDGPKVMRDVLESTRLQPAAASRENSEACFGTKHGKLIR